MADVVAAAVTGSHRAVIADRVVTACWLAYPLVLFMLPNAWQVAGIGPETLIALAYLTLLLASSLLFARPSGVLQWPRTIPLPVAVFAVLYSAGVLARGEATDAVRLLSWLSVMLIGSQLFALDWLRARFWWLWSLTAAFAAVSALATRPMPLPEVVDLFAWEHRTVFAYFLAGGLLSSIHLHVSGSTPGGRLVSSLAAVLIMLALIVSLARGAWIAAVVGSVLLYRARVGGLLRLAVLVVPLLAAVSMATGAIGEVSSRFVSIVDLDSPTSSLYRLNLYLAALQSLPDTWLAGAPVLEHGPFLARYSPVTYRHFFNEQFATDSDVIFLLLSGGVPLLLAVGWVFVRLARIARAGVRAGARDAPMLAALLALAATQALFDNLLSSALGWFYLGVLCALASGTRSAIAAGAAAGSTA